MKTCRRGHQYRGDENFRAKRACPICFRETQVRWRKTEKGKAATSRYNNSKKGKARSAKYRDTDKRADDLARYNQSPKGWLNALKKRRAAALKTRANRVTD